MSYNSVCMLAGFIFGIILGAFIMLVLIAWLICSISTIRKTDEGRIYTFELKSKNKEENKYAKEK